MHSYNLRSIVDFPTRKNNCIDNVFVNTDESSSSVRPVETALSEHRGMELSIKIGTTFSKTKLIDVDL